MLIRERERDGLVMPGDSEESWEGVAKGWYKDTLLGCLWRVGRGSCGLWKITNTIPPTTLVSATCMGNSVVGCHFISMKMLIGERKRDWLVMPGDSGESWEAWVN